MLPDVDSLVLFVRAAELRSLSKAADVSHIGVAAVSRRIALLEHHFQTSLFTRSPQGVEPTVAGMTLLGYAKMLLVQLSQIKREDMTHEQFVVHWTTTHAAMCTKLPKRRCYSVNLVDRERFPQFGYNGFSELWFGNEENVVASFASPEGKTLFADLPNFTSVIDPIMSGEMQMLWP